MSGIRESVQYDGLSVQMMENTTSEREKVIVSVLLLKYIIYIENCTTVALLYILYCL